MQVKGGRPRKPGKLPLAELRERIRAAERAQIPIGREHVSLDVETFAMLAELVERGLGRKSALLREALATGLRIMKAGSEPVTPEDVPYPQASWPPDPKPDFTDNKLIAAGLGVPIANPITVPPSLERRREEDPPDDEE